MQIKREDIKEITILTPQGEMGGNASKQLQTVIENLLKEGRNYIVLDLEEIRFLSSQMIMGLLRMNRETLASGGGIKLLRPQSVVKRFMSIGRVLELFDRFETKVEALQSFEKLKQKGAMAAKKRANPLEQAGMNQRVVLLRLMEILIQKGSFDMEEFNTEFERSSQLVFDMFRKELQSQ